MRSFLLAAVAVLLFASAEASELESEITGDRAYSYSFTYFGLTLALIL